MLQSQTVIDGSVSYHDIRRNDINGVIEECGQIKANSGKVLSITWQCIIMGMLIRIGGVAGEGGRTRGR